MVENDHPNWRPDEKGKVATAPAIINTILVVDQDPQTTNELQNTFNNEAYRFISADSGEAGLKRLRHTGAKIGLIISGQPKGEMAGLDFLKEAGRIKPDVPRILMSDNHSFEQAVEAINTSHVFSYLTKPCAQEILKKTICHGLEHHHLIRENKQLQEEMSRQNQELNLLNTALDNLVSERTAQLEEAVNEGVFMLAMAAEAKDGITSTHLFRIQNITRDLCIALGVPMEASTDFGFFATMHDVGKLHTPDHILHKTGPLDPEETKIMQQHTIMGEKILGDKTFYQVAREIARSHHEFWDGSGYPDGLAGDAIPFGARVVAVADTFDALAHDRPYKEAWSKDRIVEEMKGLQGTKFQAQILTAFLGLVDEKFVEWRDAQPNFR